MELHVDERSAVWDLGGAHDALGWTILGGGPARVERVEWHRASSSDLPEGLDPERWLEAKIHGAGRSTDAVAAFLTSRRVSALSRCTIDTALGPVDALATVGLGNALRVGDPPADGAIGTINVAVRLPVPARPEALVESLAIGQEAKALAVLESGVTSTLSHEPASGTGTDCAISLAPAPDASHSPPPLRYAGKHTQIGAAIGRATRSAVERGIAAWAEERGVALDVPPSGDGSRVVLVGGGARSGKSSFGESRALRLAADRTPGVPPVYVATAQAYDDEMRRRIDRHRADRAGRFRTIEESIDLTDTLFALAAEPKTPVVLVDCLTLWLSNLLCADLGDDAVEERIASLVEAVFDSGLAIVLVTNEVGLGIVPESALARRFRDHAGRLHQALARRADEVYFASMGVVTQWLPGPMRAVRWR
ncbi:MAG: bifunctional adenosylcobinamide kinase/adenosylcobinamide-phosphate guanylyltransferase [Planctomycetota bacterium]